MKTSPNGIESIWTEIKQELNALQDLEEELQSYLSEAGEDPGSMAKRAIGSAIHDFYSGVEKIFERISEEIDQDLPSGKDWHNRLLTRMAGEVEGVRPPVISDELQEHLEEYLRFRHLFRNIYGYKLKWERIAPLAKNLPDLNKRIRQEVLEFRNFLNQMKENLNENGD